MRDTNERLLEDFTPQHKMGFKLLTEDQLKNMFPTFENLFKKIETHLDWLRGLPGDLSKIHYQYNLMYDNVFSIMGKRGSGKTSAIFTLKRMIERKYEHHVVLPVIMPEMIPETCDIIGWILSTLEGVVTDVERQLQTNRAAIQEDSDYFKNCMFQPNNKLRREYNRVKELCFSRGYHPEGEGSFNTVIGNTERQAQNSFDFSRELSGFWTTLTDAIKKTYGRSGDPRENPPLIYILFDDVDLTPSKVIELFSTIIKYLSHPNLIIITTADEELFYEVIENNLRDKIGGKTQASFDKQLLETLLFMNTSLYYSASDINKMIKMLMGQKIQETARLYVSKILPPSCRYYLEIYDTCAKKRGFINRVEERDGMKSPVDLETLLRRCVVRYRQEESAGRAEYDNFLYYKGRKEFFIRPYLLFFGETSRQIANECFIIEDFFGSLEKIYRESRGSMQDNRIPSIQMEVYQQIYHFIYGTINANGNILFDMEQLPDLVNSIWHFEKDQWPLYVDYAYLLQRYVNILEDDPDQAEYALKSTLSLYMLLFFVENVLLTGDEKDSGLAISPNRKKIHGEGTLVRLLDFADPVYSLVKKSWEAGNGVQQFLYLNSWALENPEKLKKFDLFNVSCAEEYLYAFKNKELNRDVDQNLLIQWMRQSPKWFSTITQMLYLSYENIYLIDRTMLRRFTILNDLPVFDPYFIEKSQELSNKMSDVLGSRDRKTDKSKRDMLDRIQQLNEELKDPLYQEHLEQIFQSGFQGRSIGEVKKELESRMEAARSEGETGHTDEEYYWQYFLWCESYRNIVADPGRSKNDQERYDYVSQIVDQAGEFLTQAQIEFPSYRIMDQKRFWEVLSGLQEEDADGSIRLAIQHIREIGVGQEEQTRIAAVDLRKLLDTVLAVYRRVSTKMQKKSWDLKDSHNPDLTAVMKAYLAVKGLVQIDLNSDGTVEKAVEYIAACESLQYLEESYIDLYVRVGEENDLPGSLKYFKTDGKNYFHCSVYQQMKRIMEEVYGKDSGASKERNSRKDRDKIYLASLLHNYFVRAGRNYFDRIREIDEEDDE